jgi:sigma-B regulation protein RsbU (phosphoserine phosphatase)
MASLNAVNDVPLGVDAETHYEAAEHRLHVGDQIISYTDGISEAFNTAGEQFGPERLDGVLTSCRPGAQALIEAVLRAVKDFTAGRPADDDRTLLVAKVL